MVCLSPTWFQTPHQATWNTGSSVWIYSPCRAAGSHGSLVCLLPPGFSPFFYLSSEEKKTPTSKVGKSKEEKLKTAW